MAGTQACAVLAHAASADAPRRRPLRALPCQRHREAGCWQSAPRGCRLSGLSSEETLPCPPGSTAWSGRPPALGRCAPLAAWFNRGVNEVLIGKPSRRYRPALAELAATGPCRTWYTGPLLSVTQLQWKLPPGGNQSSRRCVRRVRSTR